MHASEPAGNRETEADTAMASRSTRVALLERLEDPFDVFRVYADSVILDEEGEAVIGTALDLQMRRTSRRREFDRVGDQIDQYLPDAGHVAFDFRRKIEADRERDIGRL